MTAVRDGAGNLIVTSTERLIRVLGACAAVGVVLAWASPIDARHALGWTAVCVVFGLAFLAADERSLVIFDRQSRMVRWRRDTPFRHSAGEVPFAAITGLSIERDYVGAPPRRGGARRLVLLTRGDTVPFTSAFTGLGSAPETVGAQIVRYLSEVAPELSVTLASP